MKVELIAEVSTGHGGSLALAKDFIRAYAEAGATFVKFQHTRARRLHPSDPQRAWFEQAEFSVEQFAELKAECEANGTQFLTTVFHPDDVLEVANAGFPMIKIGSGEAGREDIKAATRKVLFERIFVSYGLSRFDWRDATFGSLYLSRLCCVTRYPCPVACAQREYDALLGYNGWSDHAVGIEGCKIAIINGATIIEKHVSLPQQARPIRAWEASVQEFKALRAFADEQPELAIGRWNYGDT